MPLLMQICTRLRRRNKAKDWRVWLPTPACVIVAVRLSKALKDAHSKGPSNLYVHAARFYWRLHLRKWNTHSKCKCQGLVQTKVIITSHDFGPDYTPQKPKLQGSSPSEYTLYWNFFHRSGYVGNLRLPWKTEFALKFFTVLNIDLAFRIFEQLALALKNNVSWIHSIEYIHLSFRILSNLHLSWKTELLWNLLLYWNIFYYSGFFSNLYLPWKKSLPWNFLNRLWGCRPSTSYADHCIECQLSCWGSLDCRGLRPVRHGPHS